MKSPRARNNDHVPFPDDLARAAGAPPHSRGWQGAADGTVKWWKEAKGYGAVAVPELSPWDVWCHVTKLEGTRRRLVLGDRVWVEFTRGEQGSFRYVGESAHLLDPAAPSTDIRDDAG